MSVFSNLTIMKRLLYILVVIFTFCGCSWFEETKPQTPSDDSGAFKVIVGDLNGFDQFVYNENSFIVYKQSPSGLPEAMLVYVNEDGQEVVEVVYFDGRGIPQYYNINGESIYVENVRGNYCDLHLINSDGTITIIPDIDVECEIEKYWSAETTRAASGSADVASAVNLANRVLGARYLMEGSFDFGLGAYSILAGCAMLMPGVNVAVGAVLVIGGVATLTSGAMKVAKATDLLVSDGTHTDGNYEQAADAAGAIGSACGAIGGQLSTTIASWLIEQGFDYVLNDLDNRAQELERLKSAKEVVNIELKTAVADVDFVAASATLHGSISVTPSADDYVGILISEDPSGLRVADCGTADMNGNGQFAVAFDNLSRGKTYYYRAYYYSSKLDRTFVGNRGYFCVPGVKTGGYKEVSDDKYDIFINALVGDFEDKLQIGICFSDKNKVPTIDDSYTDPMEVTTSDTYTVTISPNNYPCYYRAYVVKDAKWVAYGDTNVIYQDEREILEKFYRDTGGDKWTRNDNWCTDKPLYEWYGVNINQDGRVQGISLYGNNLTGKGTLSGCTAMEWLRCNNNLLTSLDVSDCIALEDLECYSNQLTSLNVSGCTVLKDLECHNNQLTSLDVSGCTVLKGLYCSDNPLTLLNMSGCTALESFNYVFSQLSLLDVSGCTALEELYCYNNQLISLNASGCTALKSLSCSYNKLSSLDVSGCAALEELYCRNNQLATLDVSDCAVLDWLDCCSNRLSSLDLSGYTVLKCLDCSNNLLTLLDVSGCTALGDLDCSNNQLTSLDVSGCMALVALRCLSNQLTSLDVLGCEALILLHCHYNQLTLLDVSGCAALEELYCNNNKLSSLNVSGCTALFCLYCYNNKLTSLDVSGCTELSLLDCNHNKITREISGIFANVRYFSYDVRYEYYRDSNGQMQYRDHGVGWWWPGEPGKGYHGR